MNTLKIKFTNYSHVKIEADDSIIFTLRDYFSFEADGYRFNPKFKYGLWDGKIKLMGYDGMLPFGLYPFVIEWAKNNEYKCDIDPEILEIKEDISKESKQWVNDTPVFSKDTKIEPHWYQMDSILHALNNKRCILNLPTSAGKSLIQGMISKWYAQRHNDKVLVLVPSISLVKQMQGDYIDYRLFTDSDMQLIGDGKKSTEMTHTKVLEVSFGDITIRVFPTDKIKLTSGEFVEVKDLKIGLDIDDNWVKSRYENY